MKASLDEGDDVMIHASLGKLGQFDDGIASVVDCVRDAIGAAGTIVMMTDTRSFARTAHFDMNMPSETGALTEAFRRMPDVLRSCVPMVSFAAQGPRAADYTQSYDNYLEEQSTISRLLANDAKMILLGISYEKCTIFHVAEERHASSYNFYKEFAGYLYDGDRKVRPISQTYFVRKDLAMRKDPAVAGAMLEREGKVTLATLGDGQVRTFKARDFDDCCMRALKSDPNAFLAS